MSDQSSLTQDELELELIKEIAKFEHDPYGFVLFAFPWGEGALKGKSVRTWQKEILIEIGIKLREGFDRDTVISDAIGETLAIQEAVSSGHGIGKSALISFITLWAMSTKEDTKGIVTANTDTQLRTKTWPEVTKWYNLAINSHWFKITATALYAVDKEHQKTWRIDAIPWSLENTEAFAGMHNEGKRILVIFDEASAVPDKIWEVTEGALTDDNTEIIWIAFGNPTRNTGRFRECFRKYRHRWLNRQIDSRNVEGTNKAQINNWIEDYGLDSDFVKVRVRGLFPNASYKQFIPSSIADAAYNRKLEKHQYEFAPVILTCDPAWEGDDDLVIAKRQGLHFEILDVIPKNDDDMMIASKLANYEDEFGADAVFIDLGYGTGIFSCGKSLGRKWFIISFSGASSDPGCFNKRAEMYNLAKEWLKEGGCLPEDAELLDDLTAIETKSRADGKIQLESKKTMKDRGLKSPNKGDALVLSFAMPVTKKRKTPKSSASYSPGSGGWMG